MLGELVTICSFLWCSIDPMRTQAIHVPGGGKMSVPSETCFFSRSLSLLDHARFSLSAVSPLDWSIVWDRARQGKGCSDNTVQRKQQER